MAAVSPTRREDILVSVCLTDVPLAPAAFSDIGSFAVELAARFRFYEFVIVTDSTRKDFLLPLVRSTSNARLFTVRDGMSPYQHRVVAASEAIGDVVLLVTHDQFGILDCVSMIEEAADSGQIIVGLRPEPSGMTRALSVLLEVAGRAGGFRAGLQDGPTIAIPRSLLNSLLQHTDPDLALRFIPRDPMFLVGTQTSRPGKAMSTEGNSITRRVDLIDKLVLHMAPGVLRLVAFTSALLTFMGLAYPIYVIGVWVFIPKIEPGWLTISLMMSLMAVFLGGSIFGLSVGLQRILALLRRSTSDTAAQEANRTDLFGHVAAELNVDSPPVKS